MRERLLALLARFDEDAFVALANRGLLRRAQKDLERHAPEIGEETTEALVVLAGGHRVRFDARGPAHAACSCPASGTCQHVLAAALWLRGQFSASEPAEGEEEPSAREALLRIGSAELVAHAGKAGYRWAWELVKDLDLEHAVAIGGERHVVIAFQRPRMTFRYLGGGVESVIADVDVARPEKYRVAAVLAFQRAHGVEPAAPEPPAAPRSAALDLGVDHRLPDSPAAALEESRKRLRASATQLLAESVELGLSHLSPGMRERYETLAVWAQGAEYPRLALLLRRIADHVELLIERAGGADEHRLLDELTIALGIPCALESAQARREAPPVGIVGRARSRYDAASRLELWGLGASPWRSASGYVGLTMILWSPADRAFLSCTDARPQGSFAFDPVARHAAAGPWTGLASPSQLASRRVLLTGAQSSGAGRLSASEKTRATLLPPDPPGTLARQLEPWTSWEALAQARAELRQSLLAEPEPMKDWVVLRPARFGVARFSEARQVLAWPLHDAEDRALAAELAFTPFAKHAIARIEALEPGPNHAGTMVVGRIRAGGGPLVVEPLSLVHPGAGEREVDALFFDDAPKGSAVATRSTRAQALATAVAPAPALAPGPVAVRELRQRLQAQAERGVAPDRAGQWRADASAWIDRAGRSGLMAFGRLRHADVRPGEGLLRLNYLCLQLEHLVAGEATDGLG